MRLINTSTLQLHEFFERQIPQYVILSHRWTDDEVTFKDYSKSRRTESFGHRKILDFCQFARSRNHQWAWIDTACIDKRSSAELSEAINSMFDWYRDALECYAYLEDVNLSETTNDLVLKSFQGSSWFDRGCTLQELLAPEQVIFCDCDWRVIGLKRANKAKFPGLVTKVPYWSLETTHQIVSSRTGVPDEVLRRPELMRTYSVAQRMSWASRRQTTRIEDVAYCLLGLFGVNLPLLYGEGKRAFRRLQLEIMRFSHDESIFAWVSPRIPPTPNHGHTILASSPFAFHSCKNIARRRNVGMLPWTITNHGLELPVKSGPEVAFMKIAASNNLTSSGQKCLVFPLDLNCEELLDNSRGSSRRRCVIFLARMSCGHLGRVGTDRLDDDISDKGHPWLLVKSNSSSRTSIFVHVMECEDMKQLNEAVSAIRTEPLSEPLRRRHADRDEFTS